MPQITTNNLNFPSITTSKKLLKITILIFSLIITITTNTNTKQQKNTKTNFVHELNSTNFLQFNHTNSHYFLEFYAPWCGHCKQLSPIYSSAAKEAYKKNLNFKFAAINSEENEALSIKFQIKNYPTILFINNKNSEIIKFEEEKNKQNFIKFGKLQTKKTEILKISTISEFEKLTKNSEKKSEHYIVLFANSHLHKEKILNLEKMKFFAKIFNKIYLIDSFSEDKNLNFSQEIFFNKFSSSRNLIDFQFDKEKIFLFSKLCIKAKKIYEDWELIPLDEELWENPKKFERHLQFYSYPIFDETTDEIINFSLETGFNNMIVYYDNKKNNFTSESLTHSSNSSNAVTSEFIDDIKRYIILSGLRSKMIFSYSKLQNPAVKVLIQILKFNTDNMPLFLITKSKANNQEDLLKFRLDNAILTRDYFADFIEKFFTDQLPVYLASENLPKNKTDENGIYNIVGLNFKDFLSENKSNIVLCLCTKNSKMCSKFQKVLSNVGKLFKNLQEIKIGYTDANANEYEVEFKDHFPQIILLQKNEGNFSVKDRFDNGFVFDEEINTRNIARFINENTGFVYQNKLNFIGNMTEIYSNEIKKENFVKKISQENAQGDYIKSEDYNTDQENEGLEGFQDLLSGLENMGGDMAGLGDLGDLEDMEEMANLLKGINKDEKDADLSDEDLDKLKNFKGNENDENDEVDEGNDDDDSDSENVKEIDDENTQFHTEEIDDIKEDNDNDNKVISEEL